LSADPVYPRESYNAHCFSFLNATSFQIILGAPIIVYAKSLGASSTVLGILAAFTPLMTIFQIPAARHLSRYSYQQFVLMGWGLRSIFVFIIALVPLAGFLDGFGKLVVIVSCLFLFNILRGISSAAWMPWITALIPEPFRGKFLSRDQFAMYLGSLVSLVLSALAMGGRAEPWEYSVVFFISAISAVLSLWFIKRIPDVPRGETTRRTAHPVPWNSILAFPPFRALLIFHILYVLVVGSLGVFTVEYLRDETHFDVSRVLYLSAAAFVGAMLVLPFARVGVDRLGSKPLLRVAISLFGVVIAIWCAIATGIVPARLGLIAALNLLTGAAGAIFNLASLRITMATMPEMGRNHFFALFTVITSLGLGVSPIAWGMILDTLGTFDVVTGALHWKRHSIYFLALLFINLFAFLSIPRLHEPRSKPGTDPATS